jgi:quercetin 2,3-dioxygenase
VEVEAGRNVFFYLIRGDLQVNDTLVKPLHLVQFDTRAGSISTSTDQGAILLYGHAEPLNEPVVAQEIREAYRDYQLGKFGRWDG